MTAKICPHCQASNNPSFEFCYKCSHALDGSQRTAPVRPKQKLPWLTVPLVLLIALPLLFYFFYIASFNSGQEELPMFGPHPRKEPAYYFAKLWQGIMIRDKEKAFQSKMESAMFGYSRKNYRWAMKQLNRAWLLRPNELKLLNGYGAILSAMGNDEEALQWYQRGAEKGDPQAQYNVGDAYFYGVAITQDFTQAAIWYRKAADQDITWAKNMMGILYEQGLGVPQDFAEAKKWFAQADVKAKDGYQIEGMDLRGLTREALLEKIEEKKKK